jgi:CsoR family transcriptional regulator, copper-sensing transcriptional repressor
MLPTCIIPPRGYNAVMKYMDDKNKKLVIRRLKLIEGQVRGLQKMVENDTYCIDVITQTSAVKQGLSNIEDLLLENHLDHCVHQQMKSGQVAKAREEVIKVYKLKRK